MPNTPGGDGDDPGIVVEQLAPEESFERLAHEVRVQTLRTLDEHGPLAHAELRDHVGVDDPGRFNYHLGKLDGHFVRKGPEGYDLTPAGRRVVGAVLSGGYTGDLAGETIPADAACLRCGGPLVTHLEDGGVYVACTECNQRLNDVDIPPGALAGYEPSAIHDLVERWVKRCITTAQYGFCYRCDGPVTMTVVRTNDDGDWNGSPPEWAGDLSVDALVRHTCDRCGEQRHALVPSVLLLHPAVAGFHHEHEIDVRETPLSDLEWLEMGIASVESSDPLVVSIPITLDGDTLTVSVDRDLSLVDERRE